MLSAPCMSVLGAIRVRFACNLQDSETYTDVNVEYPSTRLESLTTCLSVDAFTVM